MANQDFDGTVALVTGGSGGIGKATAIILADRGADVAVLARSENQIQSTANEITEKTGRPCLPLAGDVSDYGQMQDRFAKLMDRFGRLDILINCAGINNPKPILETSIDEWQEVINVNLTGVFICCKLGSEIMVNQREGTIVNVSSVQSRVGGRSAQYSASKAGVEGLTRSLARQLADFGIRVNAVAPGSTETNLAKKYWSQSTREKLIRETLLRRIAQPEEIARVIVFVASREGSYVTGSTVHVNGGFFLN
jgi:NAD(P)-dependent dehydrogenase (short-subunit alcohol dehydrogenase family)